MTQQTSTPNADQIQRWISDYLEGTLHIAPDDIEPQRPFTEYGLDSASVVILTGDLEEWLGRDLDPSLLQTYATLEALTNYLATGEGS
ncbi:acyl carrier protein [Magnetococcus sp. PR-3]|uniref:acyl carrier protein n=1 Tax=Magnetococcus sp. PR-3 TaxID=3120355 RepID=UPI002FCDF962